MISVFYFANTSTSARSKTPLKPAFLFGKHLVLSFSTDAILLLMQNVFPSPSFLPKIFERRILELGILWNMLSTARHLISRYLIKKQGFKLGMESRQMRCTATGLNIGLASPYIFIQAIARLLFWWRWWWFFILFSFLLFCFLENNFLLKKFKL